MSEPATTTAMLDRPERERTRMRISRSGMVGMGMLAIMVVACLGSLPYTFGRVQTPEGTAVGRFEYSNLNEALLPPSWAPHADDEAVRLEKAAELREGDQPHHFFGTDKLGRDVLVRCLAGGGISLGIGLSAAMIAVFIGTAWGTIAGYAGGRTDAVMMRIVDVLFGLPYILLVVLLAVAAEGLMERNQTDTEPSAMLSWMRDHKQLINVITLLVAIGGVSWLAMARVIRGQVMSLRSQPFIEASRAIGAPLRRQFHKHLLPNLMGPIIVYATLTVPAAILSESFLSFLGIGVREPLPSLGNLAADGLVELNTVRVRWWLLLWPCLFIALTLLALNFMGEALRESLDPKRRAATAAAP